MVAAVSVLSIFGLLAIWEIIDSDVLWKSFSTIGVIGLVALVVIGISRVANNYYAGQPAAPAVESQGWKAARNVILGVVGAAFLVFAAFSIAAIWGFTGGEALYHSLSSMLLLGCSSIILLIAFKSQLQ